MRRLLRRPAACLLLPACLLLAAAMSQGAPEKEATMHGDQVVFCLRTWEGEYASSDVPGGVKITPTQNRLYRIQADGTGLAPLDLAVANAQAPAFSPDGEWLYFQSDAEGAWNIYRCRLDGSMLTNLTKGHALGKDSFGFDASPDGRRVVYTVNDGKVGRVALMAADGSGARVIAPGIGYHYMASLSPDGHTVVFSHTEDGYRLKRMGLDGGNLLTLTPEHPESFCGRFTPDGRTIVFFRRDGDVYRVDPDGRNLRRLTEGHAYVEFRLSKSDAHGSSDPPAISPDGTRIACCARVDGVPQVHVLNLDGSNRRQLTHLPGPCGRVKWSPDGKRIAFVCFVGDYPQLHVIDAAGGAPRQLPSLPGAVYSLAWRPR